MIETVVVAPVSDSLQPNDWVEVKQQSQMWFQPLCREAVTSLEEVDIDASRIPLVSNGRVCVSIAKNDGSAGECWSDNRLDMVGSIGEKQKEFCFWDDVPLL
jgi:hypothetical protein